VIHVLSPDELTDEEVFNKENPRGWRSSIKDRALMMAWLVVRRIESNEDRYVILKSRFGPVNSSGVELTGAQVQELIADCFRFAGSEEGKQELKRAELVPLEAPRRLRL
jgi:hypothetical protein